MLHTAERVPAEINVHETAGCQCDGGRNQMSPSRPSLQNRAWPTTYLQRKQAKQQPAPSSTLPATCPRDPFWAPPPSVAETLQSVHPVVGLLQSQGDRDNEEEVLPSSRAVLMAAEAPAGAASEIRPPGPQAQAQEKQPVRNVGLGR